MADLQLKSINRQPRRRESRKANFQELDLRLRGCDEKEPRGLVQWYVFEHAGCSIRRLTGRRKKGDETGNNQD